MHFPQLGSMVTRRGAGWLSDHLSSVGFLAPWITRHPPMNWESAPTLIFPAILGDLY